MTYLEIKTAINAYVANKHVDLQHQALLSWHQAQLIGQLVSRVLGNKKAPPELHEAFPGIFPEETQKKQKQQNWQVMKERVASYGARHRKRGEIQHGHDGGGTTNIDNGRDQSAPARSGERPETAEQYGARG
ncbi:hypothetical protein ABWU89_19335 [Paenibacillus amylolyticus]